MRISEWSSDVCSSERRHICRCNLFWSAGIGVPVLHPRERRAMNAPSINIAGRMIGPGHAPYVIAEMSANHNGSLDTARHIVAEAARAGADAVKRSEERRVGKE